MLQHVLVIYYFPSIVLSIHNLLKCLILIVLPVFPLFCERMDHFSKKDHNFIILEVNFFILFSKKKIRLQVLDVINFWHYFNIVYQCIMLLFKSF